MYEQRIKIIRTTNLNSYYLQQSHSNLHNSNRVSFVKIFIIYYLLVIAICLIDNDE